MALNLNAMGKKIGPLTREYTWRDVVLYALGVGAGFDDLEYCYETRLKVIPSFSIGSVFEFLAGVALTAEVNLAGILHGEQDILFHNPIPPEGPSPRRGPSPISMTRGRTRGRWWLRRPTRATPTGRSSSPTSSPSSAGKTAAFGGEDSPKETVAFPERAPDFEERAVSRPRISPCSTVSRATSFQLHVDPEFARASGFEKPIMHGLCTHGYRVQGRDQETCSRVSRSG